MKCFQHGPLLMLLVVSLASCATHRPPERAGAEPVLRQQTYTLTPGLVYTPGDWPQALAADLYRPQAAGPHPAVVLIHGGGWTRRSRDDMTPLAEQLASHGYVVFNISYRFAPAYRFPAQVHDVQQAVRWLRRRAATYDVDPHRIGGMGYSSGAHLAAMVGLLDPEDPLYDGEARLQALVLGGAPMDLRDYSSGDLVPDFLGTADGNDPVYRRASPVTHVSADDPPTLLYHGGLDLLVRPRYARAAYAALQAAQVPAELYIHPLREHVSMFVWGGGAEAAAVAFFDRHLRSPAVTAVRDGAD